MIRVRAPLNEDEHEDPIETLEEVGYKFGCKGNQFAKDLSESLEGIDEEEIALKEISADVDKVVWKIIDLKEERIRAYERAYENERSLKIKAVDALRKHEERLFGTVELIRPWYYGRSDKDNPGYEPSDQGHLKA